MQQEIEKSVRTTKRIDRSVSNRYRKIISDTRYIPHFLAKRPAKIPLSTPYLPGLLASSSVIHTETCATPKSSIHPAGTPPAETPTSKCVPLNSIVSTDLEVRNKL